MRHVADIPLAYVTTTGRSSQASDGHDMDHYAADSAAVVDHLDLRDAVRVGHSTGGGEVVRYVVKHGTGRVAKAVLIGAVPSLTLQTDANPEGLPREVFAHTDCTTTRK